MTSTKAGDIIICCIKDNIIVSSYADYDHKLNLEILSWDSEGYYVYVPDHVYLSQTKKVSYRDISTLNINSKFLDCYMAYVKATYIKDFHKRIDGATCLSCHQFFAFAASEPDKAFLCWSCRSYPYYGGEPDPD